MDGLPDSLITRNPRGISIGITYLFMTAQREGENVLLAIDTT